MKQMRNSADFLAHFLDQSFTVGEGSRGLGESFDIVAHIREIHAQSNQQLANAVVQFASETPSLVILQLQQTGREVPQTVVSYVELDRAFSDAALKVRLCFTQFLKLATACVPYGNDGTRCQQKSKHANGLCHVRNTKRMRGHDEPVSQANQRKRCCQKRRSPAAVQSYKCYCRKQQNVRKRRADKVIQEMR